MEVDEKDAQKDYETFMSDHQRKEPRIQKPSLTRRARRPRQRPSYSRTKSPSNQRRLKQWKLPSTLVGSMKNAIGFSSIMMHVRLRVLQKLMPWARQNQC